MKKGTIVKIVDGSYMCTVENGKLTHSSKKIPCIGLNTDEWVVIISGQKLPIECSSLVTNKLNKINNTIIQNLSNGEVWYCNTEINIKPIVTAEYTMAELVKLVGHRFKIKD